MPIFEKICRDKAKGIATMVTNQKATEVMAIYEYSDIIKIHKDSNDNITMIESNIVNINKPVYIGDHVWIGYGVTLLKGTYIPSGCCVVAGSIVNKKFKEENSILAGTPANCIKSNIEWSIKNPEDF